jgi:hypothetical protein
MVVIDKWTYTPDSSNTNAQGSIRYGVVRSKRGSSSKYKIVYCPDCGHELTFIREVPCMVCFNCSHTEYLQPIADPNTPGLTSIDNLHDKQPVADTSGRRIRSKGDPRSWSRYRKESKAIQPDEEARKYAESTNSYIVEYREEKPEDSNTYYYRYDNHI